MGQPESVSTSLEGVHAVGDHPDDGDKFESGLLNDDQRVDTRGFAERLVDAIRKGREAHF